MADKKVNTKKLDSAVAAAMLGDSGQFETFLFTNWKKIVAGAVALLVAVAVLLTIHGLTVRSARKGAGILRNATTTAELTAALDQYGSNEAAPAARARLAGKLIAAGEYDQALTVLRTQISTAADPMLIVRAQLDEGYVYELMGKPEAAAAAFEKLSLNSAASAGVRAEANYAAARLYAKSKELAKAVELLNRPTAVSSQVAAEWTRLSRQLLVSIENGEFGPYTPAAK